MFSEWLETEEHDGLGKASLENENNKKNSIYEHCNVPKTSQNCFSDPFMCFLWKSLPRATRIYFLGKQIPKKWGNVFSRSKEVSSRRTLPIMEYVS